MSPCFRPGFRQFMVVSNWIKTSNDSTKYLTLSHLSGSESKRKSNSFVHVLRLGLKSAGV